MGSSAMLFSAFQPVMILVGISSCSIENMNLIFFTLLLTLVNSAVPFVIWAAETEALQNMGTSTYFHGSSNSLA
jgi:hypothetical protein